MQQASTEGIAAVAARIQERSVQLSSERAVLQLVQLEQKEHEASLKDETALSQAVRQEYLSTTLARHGVELEVWNVKAKQEACLELLQAHETTTKSALETRNKYQAEWNEIVHQLATGHSISQCAYRNAMEAAIKIPSDSKETRKRQLDSLGDHLDSLDRHNRWIQEKERLQQELEELKVAESLGDDDVSCLALQVQEQVAKVSAKIYPWLNNSNQISLTVCLSVCLSVGMTKKRSKLREMLRNQRSIYKEVNGETLRWENECCNLDAETADALPY